MRKSRLARRTPLKAHKPINRGTAKLARRKPMKKRNEARATVAWARAFHSEAFVAHVHSFDCAVPGCESREIQAAHVVSRGAGGTWRDVAPLCWTHHETAHFNGIETFQRAFKVNLRDAADRVHERWLLIGGSPTEEV